MAMMKVYGHRGGKQYGPENTIETVHKAIALGAHGVEIDIQCNVDNQPMVIHDPNVERTTNGIGSVNKMTKEAIQKLDAGEGTKVPTLIEMLDTFEHKNVSFLIELKHPRTAAMTARLVDHYLTNRGYQYHQLVVISSLHQLLVGIHETYPKMVTGAIFREIPESLSARGQFTHSRFVLPEINAMSDEFVADARERGLEIIPWVCDEIHEIYKAYDYRVAGVVTSDPGYVLSDKWKNE